MPAPIVCPVCAGALEAIAFHAELSLVSSETGAIIAAQRNSRGRCPACGPRMVQHKHMGHHSTLGVVEMKRRYPKAIWPTMKSRLTAPDWRRWQAALHGRLWPTEDDKLRWDSAAVSEERKDRMPR